MNRKRNSWIILGVVLAVVVALVLTAVLVSEKPEGPKGPAPTAQPANGPAPTGDLKPEPESGEKETLRDETPDEVPAEVLKAGKRANQKNEDKLLTGPQPVGGAQNYSCRTSFIRSYSSRNGQRPLLWVNHYTVSPNRPGWSDVYGIRNYFAGGGASSHFIIDFEGNCLQIVPLGGKAWTQGAMNPVSTSVEIIATGRESRAQWEQSPLIKKGILASLARDTMRRQGIPLRRGQARGCPVNLSGWLDHNALACGNSHSDTTPGFPDALFGKQLLGSSTAPTVPHSVEVWCRKLNWFRTEVRKNHEIPPGAGKQAAERKDLILKAKFVCLSGGPVPRG